MTTSKISEKPRTKNQVYALASFLRATIKNNPGLNISELDAICEPTMFQAGVPCNKRMVQNAVANFVRDGFVITSGERYSYRYRWNDEREPIDLEDPLPVRQRFVPQSVWCNRGVRS
jgi:hypothetical protein